MHHLITEPNIEEALQAHGVSKMDILVISHDIQNQASQGNDALNQYFKQNLNDTNKDIENKKQWVERKRSNEEFFENLNTSVIIEHVIMLKIFIQIIEKEVSEKLAASEQIATATNAEKQQQEMIIHEQEKLAEINQLTGEIKSMIGRLEEIDKQLPLLLESSYQKAMELKEEKWSTPLNKEADIVANELKEKNNAELIDKASQAIDSQENMSGESKQQVREGVLKIASECNELVHKLFHNRATPEELLKRVPQLLAAVEMNYDKTRKDNKNPGEAHKAAMDVMVQRNRLGIDAALVGAYRQQYVELDRLLKSKTIPPRGIQERYGKSAMDLAKEDIERGAPVIEKYHEKLKKFIDNYNPDQGIQQLLELAHEREHLTAKIKTNVAQIGQIAEGIPEMKEQHKAGLQQLAEGMAGTPQQAEKMDRSVETAAALKGAYFQRYLALDRLLNANNPPSSINGIYGKSAMALAGDDIKHSTFSMEQYHIKLQNLIENFNPDNGMEQLLALSRERENIVGKTKSNVVQTSQTTEVTPEKTKKMDRSVETAAALKGTYFQRYLALDRQLKAGDPSSVGIQEIFGKSAMHLAHADLTKSSPAMEKYHQALEALLENFDPEKDKVKLVELANKRQELVENSKKEEKTENQSTMKPR